MSNKPGLCNSRRLMMKRLGEIRKQVEQASGESYSPIDMTGPELLDILIDYDSEFNAHKYGDGQHAVSSWGAAEVEQNQDTGGHGDPAPPDKDSNASETDNADGSPPSEGDGDDQGQGEGQGEGSDGEEDPIVAAMRAAGALISSKVADDTAKQLVDQVVDTVGARIEELAAANNELLGTLSELEEKYAKNAPVEKTYVLPQLQDPVTFDGEEYVHKQFTKLLATLQVGRHVFLSGPPGTGKSHMAQQAARALNLPYYVRSFNGQVMQHEIFGYRDAHGNYHSSDFQRAYADGGVYVADEFDNASPNLATGINQALAGDRATFADAIVERHPDFRFVACGNTIGTGANSSHVGTNRLNMATLDRLVRIHIDPDLEMERKIVLASRGDLDEEFVTALVVSIQHARSQALGSRIPDSGCGARMMLDVTAVMQTGQWELHEAVRAKTTMTEQHLARVFKDTVIAKDLRLEQVED